MIMAVFSILVVLFQIYLLVKAIKKPNKDRFVLLFVVSICFIISVILPYGFDYFDIYPVGFDFLMIYLVDIVCIPISLLIIFIGLFLMFINMNNGKYSKEKLLNVSKNLILFLVIIELIMPSVLFISEIKFYDNAEVKNQEKISDKIINDLNNQFGNGNFKIIETKKSNKDIFNSGISGYIFTISSDYIEDTFEILYDTDNDLIKYNQFLDKYYKEKFSIELFKEYLIQYKTDQVSKLLNENFNVEITFHDSYVSDITKNFGKVPSIDELTSYVVLRKPRIDLLDDINNKDDFLDYIIRFTNYYLTKIQDVYISFGEDDYEYFKFNYDYKKLGIAGDNTSYPGYAMKEDNNVRINYYTIVKTYSLDDINN